MELQPYLFFEGRAEEAIGFYREVLGAELLMLMRFRESPEPAQIAPGTEEKVMHAAMRIGGATLMLSDGRCVGQPQFGGFALSLSPPDQATAERIFAALAAGGQVVMPLGRTFWSPAFGMVTDRFGVTWMVNLAG